MPDRHDVTIVAYDDEISWISSYQDSMSWCYFNYFGVYMPVNWVTDLGNGYIDMHKPNINWAPFH